MYSRQALNWWQSSCLRFLSVGICRCVPPYRVQFFLASFYFFFNLLWSALYRKNDIILIYMTGRSGHRFDSVHPHHPARKWMCPRLLKTVVSVNNRTVPFPEGQCPPSSARVPAFFPGTSESPSSCCVYCETAKPCFCRSLGREFSSSERRAFL